MHKTGSNTIIYAIQRRSSRVDVVVNGWYSDNMRYTTLLVSYLCCCLFYAIHSQCTSTSNDVSLNGDSKLVLHGGAILMMLLLMQFEWSLAIKSISRHQYQHKLQDSRPRTDIHDTLTGWQEACISSTFLLLLRCWFLWLHAVQLMLILFI